MDPSDEFGHDPNVQQTRTYFARMEALDAGVIERSGITRLDPKLRPARAMRFRLFEAACSRAAGLGVRLDENRVFDLFEICQDRAFRHWGLEVAGLAQPEDPDLLSLVREVLK